MLEAWACRQRELLHDGPRGTGKTRGFCTMSAVLCNKYPRARILWVMNHRVDFNETVLTTFEKDVVPGSYLVTGITREARRRYTFSNGSEIIIKGLDDPQNTRSMEVDLIIVFEATNLTEEQYEMLIPLLRWGKMPYQRIICDTNPGIPAHWLLRRVARGVMHRIPSRHTDNPRFWDQARQEWTAEGKRYYDDLSRLTGAKLQRMRDGLWVAEENGVFDPDVLMRHLENCRPPTHCLKVGHRLDGAARDQAIAEHKLEGITVEKRPLPTTPADWQHRLLWWGSLVPDPRTGLLRPPQDRVYVLACDISGGNGASNSIIAIADRNTRTKVGEYVNANISPGGLARMLAILGLWCGGLRGQGHVIWEANYPGPYTGRQLSQVLMYPDLYRRDKSADTSSISKSDRLGWWNDRHTKRDAVEALRDAYARDEYHNPCEQAIQEAMQWLRWPSGDMGPGHLQEESQDARATHGDRVIADMLLILGMNIDLPTPPATHPADYLTEARMRAAGKLPELDPDEVEIGESEEIGY